MPVSAAPTHPQTLRGEWMFDFISPYAYLQWKTLDAIRARVAIQAVPILFAALLDHHGHKGPAEIPEKRRFTFRFVQWQAQRLGLVLRCPPAHPFNPLPALRLAIALGSRTEVIDAIFDHIWLQGRSADQIADLSPLAAQFGVADLGTLIAAATVKEQLRSNTEHAIQRGVFGVPTLIVGEQLFWGQDANPMILDWLDHPQLFDSPEMQRIEHLPSAAQR